MKRQKTKQLAECALLIALHIILSRFCSINAWNIKIGLAFVPVFAAAYLRGPAAAALVGGAGDFLGAVLFPIGPYFPGFTLTCALTGVLFGLLLHKRCGAVRIAGAVIFDQIILSLLLNSFWISVLYGSPYLPLLDTRIVQCVIMLPVEFLVITFLSRALLRSREVLV